jgi:hypothetical protein
MTLFYSIDISGIIFRPSLPTCLLLSYASCCVSILWIRVSQHNKIKQDRRYCVYIRFII